MEVHSPLGGSPAKITFLDGDFDVVIPGDHVVCAITGRKIPLGDLRYWSVSRQEAYVDALAANEACDKALKNGEAF